MVQAWWAAPPVAAAILFNSVFRRKSSRRSKKDEESSRDESGLSFSCERVCTSDTLLKRLGSLAKARAARALRAAQRHALRTVSRAAASTAGAYTEHVCDGVRRVECVGPATLQTLGACRSEKRCVAWRLPNARRALAATDACTEACQRAVCLNTHQVRVSAHPARRKH